MKYVSGGKTKMFGKGRTGQQAPGTTVSKPGKPGKFAAGGKTKMFGKQTVKAAKAC